MSKGINQRREFILLLCFFLSFSYLSQARISEIPLSSTHNGAILLGDPFGAIHGNLLLYLNITEAKIEQLPWYYLVVFNDHQYNELAMGDTNPCTYPSVFRSEFTEEVAVNLTVRQLDRYHVYLLNCNQIEFFYEGNVTWINEETGQLSIDEYPLYKYYHYASIPLSILTLIFVCIVVYCRKKLYALQYIVYGAVIFNTLNYLSAAFFYYEYSKTGFMNSIIEYGVFCTRVLSDTLFLTSMLLIAMGWSIIRRRLPVKNRQLLWGSIILYGGFELSNFLCDSPDNICAIYMFQVFYHVIKFLITLGIIVAINSECDKIRREFDPTDQDRLLVARKLQLYRSFRFSFAILLFTPLLFIFLDFFILEWNQVWVSEVLNQIMIIIIYWRVAVLLRPTLSQNNYIFIRTLTAPNVQNNIEEELLVAENQQNNNEINSDDDDVSDNEENEDSNIIENDPEINIVDLRSHFIAQSENNADRESN